MAEFRHDHAVLKSRYPLKISNNPTPKRPNVLGNCHRCHAPSVWRHGPNYSYTEDRTLSRRYDLP